jgi:hypothetical protein
MAATATAAGVVAAAAAAVGAAGAGEEAFSVDETNTRYIAGIICAMTASIISLVEAPAAISASAAVWCRRHWCNDVTPIH